LPARDGEPLIGYWVAKPYWNQGICTEALRLMLDHIRQTTDIKSLISGHFVDNPASGRVMEKCGFVPTGETCIDANQYQGANRSIRVLRLEIKTNMDNPIKSRVKSQEPPRPLTLDPRQRQRRHPRQRKQSQAEPEYVEGRLNYAER